MRFVLLIVALAFTGVQRADAAESFQLRKLRAIQSAQNHESSAENTLKQLLAERPNDGDMLFWLGTYLADKGRQLKPGKARKALMRDARKYCVEAKKHGFQDPLVETTLAAINEDGSE